MVAEIFEFYRRSDRIMAFRTFLRAKLHRAIVTQADLDYMGSISICPELLKQSGIAPYEQVDVYNVTSGSRFTTYAIEGGPGEICVNGAAAHLAEIGDVVIIACYQLLEDNEISNHVPKALMIGPDNKIIPNQ